MTTTNLTRRAALAGSVALPLVPAAAMAIGKFPQWAEPDPAVLAFDDWKAAYEHERRICRQYGRMELVSENAEAFLHQHVLPAHDRRNEAEARIAAAVPTTAAGLVALLHVTAVVTESVCGAPHDNIESRLVLSALEGAKRLAGEEA